MDDLISRKSVLKIIGDIWLSCSDYGLDIDHFYEEVVSAIENELPSVQPKVGYWEWNQYDANPKIGNFHCSLCHSIGRAYFDFCPYCGAKMQEVQDEIGD